MTTLPARLLIYYGYPSRINGTVSVEGARQHFEAYQLVVIGDKLEQATHPDHSPTKEIISSLKTQFFGYIDLGVHTPHGQVQNLPISEIERRVELWQKLGVVGILLDDFGYDFGVSRERQNQAVSLCHQAGLKVIANSWQVADCLGSEAHPLNRRGTPPRLRASDYYLWESYQIKQGAIVTWKNWREKAQQLAAARARHKIGVLSCTTTERADEFREAHLQYSYAAAALEGHCGFGWGEPHFGATDNQAPLRQLELPFAACYGRPQEKHQALQRFTDKGLLQLDHQRLSLRLEGHLPIHRRLLDLLGF